MGIVAVQNTPVPTAVNSKVIQAVLAECGVGRVLFGDCDSVARASVQKAGQHHRKKWRMSGATGPKQKVKVRQVCTGS